MKKRILNQLHQKAVKKEADLIIRITDDNWESIFKQLIPIQQKRVEIYKLLNL